MRWRFLDRVDEFEPWERISGRKAISLEEYSLLERLGRPGSFPESLVLETCVELVRWLVAASSGFTWSCVLTEVDGFRVERETGPGEVLELGATVERRPSTPLRAVSLSNGEEGGLRLACRVESAGRPVAAGVIGMNLTSLEEGFDPKRVEGIWRELYGPA